MQQTQQMTTNLILPLFAKSVNKSLCSEGVVQSALGLREFPSLRIHLGANIPRITYTERAVIAQLARKLIRIHLASARVNTALKRMTPAAVDYVYQQDKSVLTWHEKQIENRKVRLFGPYTVTAIDSIGKSRLLHKGDKVL